MEAGTTNLPFWLIPLNVEVKEVGGVWQLTSLTLMDLFGDPTSNPEFSLGFAGWTPGQFYIDVDIVYS
jgi:hypothetical protein